MQPGIDAGERSQIDDGIPAHLLPNAGPDVHMPEVFGLAHDVGRRAAQRAHDGAHPAAVDGEHAVHHAHKHDDGDEVRQVGDRLGDLAKAAAGHGVHDQRQQNRHREAGQQVIEAQDQRVAHERGKVVAVEEVVEPLHAHPLAARDAVGKVEIAEGDLHAVHRPVMKDEDIQEGGENHQVERAVIDHPADGLLPVLSLDGWLHAGSFLLVSAFRRVFPPTSALYRPAAGELNMSKGTCAPDARLRTPGAFLPSIFSGQHTHRYGIMVPCNKRERRAHAHANPAKAGCPARSHGSGAAVPPFAAAAHDGLLRLLHRLCAAHSLHLVHTGCRRDAGGRALRERRSVRRADGQPDDGRLPQRHQHRGAPLLCQRALPPRLLRQHLRRVSGHQGIRYAVQFHAAGGLLL